MGYGSKLFEERSRVTGPTVPPYLEWNERIPSLMCPSSGPRQRLVFPVAHYARSRGDAAASIGTYASITGRAYIRFSSKSEMGSLCNERLAETGSRQMKQ